MTQSPALDPSTFLDIIPRMATAVRSDHARAARLFHALSDEIRLEVIELLRGGERCVCELTDELDIAQPRLSWHLKALKDAGIVRDRREGRWIYYTLAREAFDEATTLVAALRPVARRLPVKSGCC
jgi:ArsR family transcriptional regulator